jgi:hypothetical protein
MGINITFWKEGISIYKIKAGFAIENREERVSVSPPGHGNGKRNDKNQLPGL